MAGASGNAAMWLGQHIHRINSYEDLTVDMVIQKATERWLDPKEYVAILLNNSRYTNLLWSANPSNQASQLGGKIFLCPKTADDGIDNWVLLEEGMETVGSYAHMEKNRWGIPRLEKRRYTLLTRPENAIFHYRPISADQANIVKIKTSISNLKDKATDLDNKVKNMLAGLRQGQRTE